jgi:mono/diheme cytochrome c family protein
MKTINKILLGVIAIGVVIFGGIQLVPVNRTNPLVVTQVQWDSPQTQALFQRACADCHSNETVWPWYSYVAPVSWLIARDVFAGRSRFNISDLNTSSPRFSRMTSEIGRTIQSGRMPMAIYIPMHPSARLTPQEAQELASGLQATLLNSIAPAK